MRKHQQRLLLELLQTIKQAQSEGLYADCQAGAQSVGEFIESIEGEGTKTVGLLENYCELLFKVSNGEISEKRLRKQLIQIENSVKSELKPNKIEIAFLSYNASMSDSIESIYLAAKADPICDAHWIPIPFFEKNTDGSFGTMRYEGANCYGDDIECTDWQKYDIEARHPDVIFTFNPYDAGNYVTSVHPDFYCERLRNLTDLLVYIPYFVITDDVPDHFCTVAGCVYAHKVIIQSEKVRDSYICAFKENFGSRFGKPEDKFIALGSPKFDKIINTKREDCKLPAEWRGLIADKKVVFYNTSVGSILKGNEQYLKKLRSVLDVFRSRNDVVLWWRPHPLNEATVSSMRPKLLDEYELIITEYRRQNFGIYDDTADLHRALTWSDAYYGDASSIVAMYGITGKPIMTKDIMAVQDNTSYFALNFERIYDDGRYFWFTAFDFNALFRMDKISWETEYIGSFPDEASIANRLFSGIAMNNDKLFFSPLSGTKIAVFDMKDCTFQTILFKTNLARSPQSYNESAKFINAVAYDKWVFFIGCSYPSILKLDTTDGMIDYFSGWASEMVQYISNPFDVYWGTEACIVGSHIFVAANNANIVMDFDMDNCSAILHQIGSEKYCYSSISYDGNEFWLSPRNNTPIVNWNPSKNNIVEYNKLPPGFIGEISSFWTICSTCGETWLFPFYANMALCINNDKNIFVSEAFQVECSVQTEHGNKTKLGSYVMARVIGDTIYAHTGKSNTFISYNTVSGVRREEHIVLCDKQLEKMRPLRRQSYIEKEKYCDTALDCIFNESYIADLNSYIDYIVKDCDTAETKILRERQKKLFKQITVGDTRTTGQAIYNFAKKTILG